MKTKLQPTCDEWYPKLIGALPSKDYTPPGRVSIVITNNYRGVAATGGNHVSCSPHRGSSETRVARPPARSSTSWYTSCSNTTAAASNAPGWLVEGIADYFRWFKYEPRPTGTRPRNPDTASYTDSYRITAGFLNYVVNKHDKELVVKLNAAMRQGKYSPDLWKESTGKTLDELWKDYVATLQ